MKANEIDNNVLVISWEVCRYEFGKSPNCTNELSPVHPTIFVHPLTGMLNFLFLFFFSKLYSVASTGSFILWGE